MKTTKLFFMAALALMTAACSNDDNDLTTPQPQKAEGITITAQLAPKTGGATTRAVSDGGNKIESVWAENEHIAVLYEVSSTKYVADATITAVDGSGTATITFNVDGGTPDNTACTLVYPYSAAKDDKSGVKDDATLLAAQDGVLDGDLDVRVGAGTIQTATPGLTVTTQPAALYSIFKFTLKDIAGSNDKSASEFKVSNASGDVLTTVTPGSATNELYVALPALAAGTYWFNATVGGAPYIAKATVSTATTAGNYYQTTVKMATLGDLMGADGKFYATSTAISTASTTAIGVIAHIGNDACTETIANGGGHGLVLCLKNAASGADAQWSTETSTLEFGDDAKVTDADGLKRTTSVSGYTNTKTLAEKTDAATKYKAAYAAKNYTGLTAPAGTTGWFLPSAQQWVKMQEGLGGLAESAIVWDSWFNNDHSAATAWETAMAKAGTKGTAYDSMTDAYLWYWSSSEFSADRAVFLDVDATGTGGDYGFLWGYDIKDSKNVVSRVRPVLAF